jgi:16S rRNA C967 or C1407 C5-methylase (RsmB/RsmF family)
MINANIRARVRLTEEGERLKIAGRITRRDIGHVDPPCSGQGRKREHTDAIVHWYGRKVAQRIEPRYLEVAEW